MALKLGVSQGDQIHYSVGGQEFLGPIRVLPTPTEAQLRAAALQGEHSHLAGEALDRRIAELRAEHQRYVVVPLGGIQRLMTAGISVQMPARAAA